MKVYVGDNSEAFLSGPAIMLPGAHGTGHEQKNKMHAKIDSWNPVKFFLFFMFFMQILVF